MKVSIVVTSIFNCSSLLNAYLANIAKYGHNATIYLIPDVKTPSFTVPGIIIPNLTEQDAFLTKVGLMPDFVPRNSDNRRNVGYLMALANGADVLISLDDDNWCYPDQDFIGEHLVVTKPIPTIWFDPCSILVGGNAVHARGFPDFAKKTIDDYQYYPIAINTGLWIGEPDLDAVTWLKDLSVRTTGLRASHRLAPYEWAPINSQNTAVHRDVIPAYYFVRQDPPADRFGDIFQGYFALACAKHFGYTARFGTPVVNHIRNSHVHQNDVAKETPMMIALEELLPKLTELNLTASNWHETYIELAYFIASQGGDFYKNMSNRMFLWANCCKGIG